MVTIGGGHDVQRSEAPEVERNSTRSFFPCHQMMWLWELVPAGPETVELQDLMSQDHHDLNHKQQTGCKLVPRFCFLAEIELNSVHEVVLLLPR